MYDVSKMQNKVSVVLVSKRTSGPPCRPRLLANKIDFEIPIWATKIGEGEGGARLRKK